MIASVPLAKISIDDRSRSLCENAVASLVESIKTIGLQVPISVQSDQSSRDESYLLVAGLHRLEACRRLGMAHIDARIIDLDETERRLWEIAENLHRAELTALERLDHVDQWIKLSNERQLQSAQLAPIESKRADGRGHRREGGINAAVRELGVNRTEAQRAVKIAALAPDAKAEARALGLDDNRSALLKAAKAPSKEAQIRALREEAARKAAGRGSASVSRTRIEAAMSAVKRLSQDELASFADWFDGFRAERGEREQLDTNAGWTARI
jgi:ParB-like chromosome segregation protein Spo0J